MSDNRDAALFLALAAVWGSAFVATKAALAAIPPVLLAALRFDVVALLLFVAALATGRRLRPRGRGDWLPILTGGAFSIGAHHALLFSGQQYVTSAVASTLLGSIPVLTPVATHLLRTDQRPGATTVAGLLAGFAGVVLIADPDPDALLAGATGTLLVFGAAVAFVLGAVSTDERRATLSPFALQAWMALVGAGLLHAAALGLPGESLAAATWTPTAVGWLLYLAVVPGAAGFFTYFRLLDRLGPLQVGLLEYAIPPFAAAFGWLVLREPLAPSTVAGFATILVGFLLVKSGAIVRALERYRHQPG
ncbi:MAG: DMT family transporter [Haloferacaceae archaeon]